MFFHAKAAQRRKQNNIYRIEDSTDRWITVIEEVQKSVIVFYEDLFIAGGSIAIEEAMFDINRKITHGMNKDLSRDVSEVEIKEAAFSMHPIKAPGRME